MKTLLEGKKKGGKKPRDMKSKKTSVRLVSVFNDDFVCMAYICMSFPCGSDSKESACSAGDPGLIPGSGRSCGEGNGYPLQYSCLENSMDRGDWLTAVHVIAKSWTRLSYFPFFFYVSN